MTKFPNLLNTLEGLVNNSAHKKIFVHQDEIIKGNVLELHPSPTVGIHTAAQAIIFIEKDTVAIFFAEEEDFVQIHDSNRQFVSFLNPCLLKMRFQNTEAERISVQMHLLQLFLHTTLVQKMITGEQYEATLEELKHLFSKETMAAYRKVQEWIHRHDHQHTLMAA